MSWSRARADRRQVAAGLLAALGLTAAGCGFQPLYGRGSVGTVDAQLAEVKIAEIPDRIGQQVHNYLLDRINRKGAPAAPVYLLAVTLQIDKTNLGILRDETATRAKLVLSADVVLSEIETGKILLKRSTRSANSYNIVDSAVATRSAELDAIDRAAREVSEEIRVLLALYFRRRAGEENAP